MALINCPECEKEISDKAGACPHCGCPINSPLIGNASEQKPESNMQNLKKNTVIKKIMVALIVLIIVSVVGILAYNVTVIQPERKYEKAIALLESGKYEEAKELLEKIPTYKDTNTILEQIKWESKAYQCIDEWKQMLKNPDSFVLHELYFYRELDSNKLGGLSTSDAVCIMRAGGQNGFGGNTSSYIIFSADNNEVVAYCDTLDIDDIDLDDDDGLLQYAACIGINEYFEKGVEIGKVDMSRLKTVLKNDAYSTIKIIE